MVNFLAPLIEWSLTFKSKVMFTYCVLYKIGFAVLILNLKCDALPVDAVEERNQQTVIKLLQVSLVDIGCAASSRLRLEKVNLNSLLILPCS